LMSPARHALVAPARRHLAFRLLIMSLAVLTTACGDGSRSSDTFIVEVKGSRQTLESFELRAPGLDVSPLTYDSGFVRTLSTDEPWSRLRSRTFELMAFEHGEQISTVRVSPFLCPEIQGFDRSVDDGWKVVETQQAFLLDTGVIELDTDFDHPLHYACEQSQPDGSDGDGLGTIVHEEPICSDEDRKGTELRLTGTLANAHVDSVMQTCWAALSDVGAGRISLTLNTMTDAGTVTIGLSRCLATEEEPFPMELTPVDADEACPTTTSTILRASSAEERLSTSGRWLIASADYSKGGHVVGEIEVTATARDGSEVRIAGPYDLPFIRIPIEGDWHP
jgi:hypothetical protein